MENFIEIAIPILAIISVLLFAIISTLIIVFVAAPAVVITISAVIARNEHYEEFVKENSVALKEIKSINNTFHFIYFRNHYLFEKDFLSRRQYENYNDIDFFYGILCEDMKKWNDLKFNVIANRDDLKKYREQISKVHMMSKALCETNKMDFDKCISIEKEMVSKMYLKPITDFEIKLYYSYSSAGGRVHLSHTKIYGFDGLCAALQNIELAKHRFDEYDDFVRVERSLMTNSLRYEVMRRDGFRCVLCGASAKDGARLHVDHIYPVSKGGKTVMNNLRTLCDRCNLGKSDKIECVD